MMKKSQHRVQSKVQLMLNSSSFDEAREGELEGRKGERVDATYVLQGHGMDHQHEQEVPGI